jgi:hypothetical protein
VKPLPGHADYHGGFFLATKREEPASIPRSVKTYWRRNSVGQAEMKRCSFIDLSFSPDASTMTLENTLNQRQPDSAALKLITRVQSLERAKQFLHVLHVEPHTVVSNRINSLATLPLAAHFNDGLLPLARELEGIGKNVQEDLPKEGWVAPATG